MIQNYLTHGCLQMTEQTMGHSFDTHYHKNLILITPLERTFNTNPSQWGAWTVVPGGGYLPSRQAR